MAEQTIDGNGPWATLCSMPNQRTRIVIDPLVHFGKPCVSGTRITVECVLELIQEGIPFSEIVDRYYPALTVEDVKECAAYATNLVRSEEIHMNA